MNDIKTIIFKIKHSYFRQKCNYTYRNDYKYIDCYSNSRQINIQCIKYNKTCLCINDRNLESQCIYIRNFRNGNFVYKMSKKYL